VLTFCGARPCIVAVAEKTGRFWPQDPRSKYKVAQWVGWQLANQGPKLGEQGHFRRAAESGNNGDLTYALRRFDNEVHRIYGVVNLGLFNKRYLAVGAYTIILCYDRLRHWGGGDGGQRGIVGLGNMGGPMALNLVKAGFELVVHDINAEHGSCLRRQSANAAGNQFPCGTLSDHWWARQSTFAETHGNDWEAPIAADADAVRSGGIQSRTRWRNCRHSNSAPTEPEAPAKAGSFGPTKMQELAGNGSTPSTAASPASTSQNWPPPALGACPAIAVQGGIR
jgi:hypothetical protein